MSLVETMARRASRAEIMVRELLVAADIDIDGSAPHDIRVHDERFFERALRAGSLGLGESYMDGWWDSNALDETLHRIIEARLDERVRQSPRAVALVLAARLRNLQSPLRAFEVGQRHYDIGNDLYRAMLDSRMAYSCAYWNGVDTLDAAQEAKLDLVCRKVGLRPGMTLLDLGCGWGSLARFAAERHGVRVVGYTVSREQLELGRELCAGLPVELRLEDYRQATGTYDAVVSIGFMEHVGSKNYAAYMDVVDRCLAPDGVALVHTIAGNISRSACDPWFHRYIFPNGQIPSIAQLGKAMEGRFALEDVHNVGPHYDRTLMAWHRNIEAAWPHLPFDERFRRMWRYYLMTSAAAFRCRYLHVYQIVMTRIGTPQPGFCRQL